MTPSAFLEAMERACAEAQVSGLPAFIRGVTRSLGLRDDDATWPALAERLAELAAEARRCEDKTKEVSDE